MGKLAEVEGLLKNQSNRANKLSTAASQALMSSENSQILYPRSTQDADGVIRHMTSEARRFQPY